MKIFGIDDLVRDNDLVLFDTNVFCPLDKKVSYSLSEKKEVYSAINPFFEMFKDYLESEGDGGKIRITQKVFSELLKFKKIKSNGRSGAGKNHRLFLDLRRELNRFYDVRNKIRDEFGFMNRRIVNSDYVLNKDQEKYFLNLRAGVDNLLKSKRKNALSDTDYDLFLNSLIRSKVQRVALVSSDEGVYLLNNFHFKNRPFEDGELFSYGFNFYEGFFKIFDPNASRIAS